MSTSLDAATLIVDCRCTLGEGIIANSICFSPDGGTMDFCDSPRRQIMRCA